MPARSNWLSGSLSELEGKLKQTKPRCHTAAGFCFGALGNQLSAGAPRGAGIHGDTDCGEAIGYWRLGAAEKYPVHSDQNRLLTRAARHAHFDRAATVRERLRPSGQMSSLFCRGSLALSSSDAPAARSVEPWTPPSAAVENRGRGQAKAQCHIVFPHAHICIK